LQAANDTSKGEWLLAAGYAEAVQAHDSAVKKKMMSQGGVPMNTDK